MKENMMRAGKTRGRHRRAGAIRFIAKALLTKLGDDGARQQQRNS
jgi:hypothetical protein